jgi:hypothetical protein
VPCSTTRDALARLRGCLQAQPPSRRAAAALCAPCDHVSQRRAPGSSFACGYRNMQMLCSALLASGEPQYRAALFGGCGYVPDVAALQWWLERAWRLGFDPEGAAQLGGRVSGTARKQGHGFRIVSSV